MDSGEPCVVPVALDVAQMWRRARWFRRPDHVEQLRTAARRVMATPG